MMNLSRFSARSAIVGALLVSVGFLVGTRASTFGFAQAQTPKNDGAFGDAGENTFAVGIGSADGFAIVRDCDGHVFVVNCNGVATRVLYSTSGAAPDKPGPQTEQLVVQ